MTGPAVVGFLRLDRFARPTDAAADNDAADDFDARAWRAERAMRAYAAAADWHWRGVVVETVSGSLAGIGELVTALRAAGARRVLVPDLDHLARHPLLCALLVDRLACQARAEVYELPAQVDQAASVAAAQARRLSE